MGLGSIFYGWVSELVGLKQMYLAAGLLLLAVNLVFNFIAPEPGQLKKPLEEEA